MNLRALPKECFESKLSHVINSVSKKDPLLNRGRFSKCPVEIGHSKLLLPYLATLMFKYVPINIFRSMVTDSC